MLEKVKSINLKEKTTGKIEIKNIQNIPKKISAHNIAISETSRNRVESVISDNKTYHSRKVIQQIFTTVLLSQAKLLSRCFKLSIVFVRRPKIFFQIFSKKIILRISASFCQKFFDFPQKRFRFETS